MKKVTAERTWFTVCLSTSRESAKRVVFVSADCDVSGEELDRHARARTHTHTHTKCSKARRGNATSARHRGSLGSHRVSEMTSVGRRRHANHLQRQLRSGSSRACVKIHNAHTHTHTHTNIHLKTLEEDGNQNTDPRQRRIPAIYVESDICESSV